MASTYRREYQTESASIIDATPLRARGASLTLLLSSKWPSCVGTRLPTDPPSYSVQTHIRRWITSIQYSSREASQQERGHSRSSATKSHWNRLCASSTTRTKNPCREMVSYRHVFLPCCRAMTRGRLCRVNTHREEQYGDEVPSSIQCHCEPVDEALRVSRDRNNQSLLDNGQVRAHHPKMLQKLFWRWIIQNSLNSRGAYK